MIGAIERPAVIVVDMINEYVHTDGKLYCPNAGDITARINRLTEHARAEHWPVIFVNTALDSVDDTIARRFGLHAERGSWGAELSESIASTPSDKIVEKRYYDSFHATELEDILQAREIAATIICGIHTHVCVLLTAVGAFSRGYDVVVVEDAVTTDDPSNHDSRLPFFRKHVGRLMLTSEITS